MESSGKKTNILKNLFRLLSNLRRLFRIEGKLYRKPDFSFYVILFWSCAEKEIWERGEKERYLAQLIC